MAVTLLTGLAAAASIAGSVAGIAGTLMTYSANKKAERLRERQMNLEAARQKRGVAREANRQRALLAVQANAQGSNMGSGVAGAQAQSTASAADATLAINQSQQIGAGIFAANRKAATGGMISGLGSGLQNLAGSIADSQERMRRLTDYYGTA